MSAAVWPHSDKICGRQLTARQTSALDDEQSWVRVMQCLSCGGEMRLIAVAQDQQLSVPGYMHHTFQCAACNEVETRFLFSRELPVPVAPVINPWRLAIPGRMHKSICSFLAMPKGVAIVSLSL